MGRESSLAFTYVASKKPRIQATFTTIGILSQRMLNGCTEFAGSHAEVQGAGPAAWRKSCVGGPDTTGSGRTKPGSVGC